MLKQGATVDRYTLEAILGEGGMGSVYLAHDARHDRNVALKVLRAPEKDEDEAARKEATARLVREARAAAKLDHPNAVSIFDVGEVEGTAFIAMELVPGKTLRALANDGGQPLASRVRWLADVARALAAAHRAGLVHRDVKPENVMVRPDGTVTGLDFGIARRASHAVDPSAPTESGTVLTLTAAGINVGTPLYMAPEQIKSEPIDGRTDQFAWGVLAYELITEAGPVGQQERRARARRGDPDPAGRPAERECAEELGPEVESVVMRALKKSPADRFANMDELLIALEGGDRAAVSAPPATQRTTSKPPVSPIGASGPSMAGAPDPLRGPSIAEATDPLRGPSIAGATDPLRGPSMAECDEIRCAVRRRRAARSPPSRTSDATRLRRCARSSSVPSNVRSSSPSPGYSPDEILAAARAGSASTTRPLRAAPPARSPKAPRP